MCNNSIEVPFTLAPGAQPPRRAHASDAGWDLSLMVNVKIPVNGHVVASTGVSVDIPDGYVGKVFVRSSLGFKRHVVLSNGTGIIDAGYTGEIMVSLHNEGTAPVWLRGGERVAQLVVEKLPVVEFVEVEELGASERGVGGFGSTGLQCLNGLILQSVKGGV